MVIFKNYDKVKYKDKNRKFVLERIKNLNFQEDKNGTL